MPRRSRTLAVLALFGIESLVVLPALAVAQSEPANDEPADEEPRPRRTPRRRCKLVTLDDGRVVKRCKRLRRCKRVTLADGRVVKRCKRIRRRQPEMERRRPEIPPEPPIVFEGPRFEGGFRLYFLTDFHDEGTTSAFDLTIFPFQERFRLGLSGEVGIRDLATENDIVVRSYASAGYQRPGRWTPFVVGILGGGVLAYERFGFNEWTGLLTAGAEGGVEVRLGRHVLFGAALGLQRTIFLGAMYDSITLRASLGF